MDTNRVLPIDIVVDKGNHVNEIIENLRKVSFGRKDNDMRDYFFPRSGLVQRKAKVACEPTNEPARLRTSQHAHLE